MNVQQIKFHQNKPGRSPWLFWFGLGITVAITLGLIGLIIWLVRTQSLSQLYILISIIGSSIGAVTAPLTFYVTVVKRPEKQKILQTPQHQAQPLTLWNVPYRRNDFFTGREEILRTLHERLTTHQTTALTQPQSQAISGLGGIGKTQIAIEYAYRYRVDYRAILWVKADTHENILASFQELATMFALPEQQEADLNKVARAVKRWLVEHDGWLLIFDNADNLNLVGDFLPASESGALLLTTRHQATRPLADPIEITQMDRQEGTLLLLRRAGRLPTDGQLAQANPKERDLAEQIVQKMDGLPLALDQAAAYIEQTNCPLENYLKKYDNNKRMELLHERGNDPYKHDPVATTWSLNFKRVVRATNDPLYMLLGIIQPKTRRRLQVARAASDLLNVLAFLAPDAIPEDLLIAGASQLGPSLEGIAKDETLLDRAIGSLRQFSLVQRNPDLNLLSIHRLVQEIFRTRMPDKTRRRWAERTVRAVNAAFPGVDFSTWPQCERYLPHALACATLVENFSLAFREAARLLNATAYYLHDHAQYSEAEPLYQRALAISEQTLGTNHPDTATCLHNLAGLYDDQGQYEQAMPLYQRALAIWEQALGSNHPNMASILNNLAGLYYDQGQYEQAEPLVQLALAIWEQPLGPNHPDTATSLNNLALLYHSQGKYEQAEPLYQRALAILESRLGPNHPTTKIVRSNYAELLEEMKRKKRSS
jgi:tetratricopeptide (TPR) repeat protein